MDDASVALHQRQNAGQAIILDKRLHRDIKPMQARRRHTNPFRRLGVRPFNTPHFNRGPTHIGRFF